jgi:hypothetical protein
MPFEGASSCLCPVENREEGLQGPTDLVARSIQGSPFTLFEEASLYFRLSRFRRKAVAMKISEQR